MAIGISITTTNDLTAHCSHDILETMMYYGTVTGADPNKLRYRWYRYDGTTHWLEVDFYGSPGYNLVHGQVWVGDLVYVKVSPILLSPIFNENNKIYLDTNDVISEYSDLIGSGEVTSNSIQVPYGPIWNIARDGNTFYTTPWYNECHWVGTHNGVIEAEDSHHTTFVFNPDPGINVVTATKLTDVNGVTCPGIGSTKTYNFSD